jgi:hypothetical protein
VTPRRCKVPRVKNSSGHSLYVETIRQVGRTMFARVFREVALAAARASRALRTPRYLIGLVTLASAMALFSFGAAQAQIATSTQLNIGPNPSAAGEGVTFNATILPATPGAQPPTGTVTFFDGGNQIGTGTLTAEGSASFAIFSTGTLSVGSHTITTIYPGDANFGSSSGGPLTQTVNKNNTTTLSVASPNPSTVGQPVGFDIVISPVTPDTFHCVSDRNQHGFRQR